MKRQKFNEMEYDIEIGKRIREIRKIKGISQEELGNLVGLTFQQIQKYENAKSRVSFSRLCSIAEALGVTLADFIDLDEPTLSRDLEKLRRLNQVIDLDNFLECVK